MFEVDGGRPGFHCSIAEIPYLRLMTAGLVFIAYRRDPMFEVDGGRPGFHCSIAEIPCLRLMAAGLVFIAVSQRSHV